MSKLALYGGGAVRAAPFPKYNTIGAEEKAAVAEVLDSGCLSGFLGRMSPEFYGGPKVRQFEEAWSRAIGSTDAVSVNSATSALQIAVSACALGHGDEVIVSPYTMSASASAPCLFGATPVFADIDPETYCLSAETIEPRITGRTRAIIVVHLFGHPADMGPILDLATRHDLAVIEDCAQAPLARYQGKFVGSLGQIGVFSLNYHKHIHCGEGGIATSSHGIISDRLRAIRNHAECVADDLPLDNLRGVVGFNMRLGEMEAAIGLCQLAKAPTLIAERQANVKRLEGMLVGIPGLSMPVVKPGCEHVYYLHALSWDAEAGGCSRAKLVRALNAELPAAPFREGYITPLYYQTLHLRSRPADAQALFPNTERAWGRTVIAHDYIKPGMTEADLRDIADALHKVAENVGALR